VPYVDAREPLPFKDDLFDYVFCEHLLEHLTYREALRFVKECFRIIKPNGKLRIATPDLQFLIDLYSPEKTTLQQNYIKYEIDTCMPDLPSYEDTFVINIFFRSWGHRFIFDYKSLRALLERCEFVNVTRESVGSSLDPNLQGIESHGKVMPPEFNQLETMVVTATKPAWTIPA
jgi:predicted SAM-dependent methyltransferase